MALFPPRHEYELRCPRSPFISLPRKPPYAGKLDPSTAALRSLSCLQNSSPSPISSRVPSTAPQPDLLPTEEALTSNSGLIRSNVQAGYHLARHCPEQIDGADVCSTSLCGRTPTVLCVVLESELCEHVLFYLWWSLMCPHCYSKTCSQSANPSACSINTWPFNPFNFKS